MVHNSIVLRGSDGLGTVYETHCRLSVNTSAAGPGVPSFPVDFGPVWVSGQSAAAAQATTRASSSRAVRVTVDPMGASPRMVRVYYSPNEDFANLALAVAAQAPDKLQEAINATVGFVAANVSREQGLTRPRVVCRLRAAESLSFSSLACVPSSASEVCAALNFVASEFFHVAATTRCRLGRIAHHDADQYRRVGKRPACHGIAKHRLPHPYRGHDRNDDFTSCCHIGGVVWPYSYRHQRSIAATSCGRDIRLPARRYQHLICWGTLRRRFRARKRDL